jgi:hypothetical protein
MLLDQLSPCPIATVSEENERDAPQAWFTKKYAFAMDQLVWKPFALFQHAV